LVQGGLRLGQASSGLVQGGLGLLQGGLERPRIDLEERLPPLDEIALFVVLLDEVALDLRTNRGIHHAIRRGDPLGVHRDVSLVDRYHFNGRRRRRVSRLTLAAS